jgi:hypothetical protein
MYMKHSGKHYIVMPGHTVQDPKISIIKIIISTLHEILQAKVIVIENIPKQALWSPQTAFAVPSQAWSGPEGSRKLRFPDFMTMAQDGCKVVSFTHRPPLPPGNVSGTHFH